MDFVSIIRMFNCAEWTGNFELHISLLEQMLLYLAADSHDKYAVAIQKCFFWSGTFTDQVTEKTLMRSGKSQGELINITHNDVARKK